MHVIFQKKGKKGQTNVKKEKKKGKIFKNLGKMYKILKYFKNGKVIVCNYRTH